MKGITILILNILLSIHINAKTYFVAATGLNTNNGNLATPFKTIQYGITNAIAGDSIIVKSGTYKEKITFIKSGTSGKFIFLIGEGKPKLDGTGLSPSGQEGLINISNQSYIHIEGFDIGNFTSTTANFPVGIWVEGKGGFITIKNNFVHHIQGTNGAHGVAFYGTSNIESLHDLVFDNNEVAFCKTFDSEATAWNGNVVRFTVTNNSVHDCDNIAYDFIGWEGTCTSCTGNTGNNVDRARNGLVQNNLAFNITSWGNAAYGNSSSAGGYYVDGGDSIVFDRNTAHHCDIGIELASEHYGKPTSRIIVRNNLIYNNYAVGLATGGYASGTGAGGGSAENCLVINNTFYKNNTSPNNDAWGAELLLQNRNINNQYVNNIVYAASGFPLVDESGTLNTGNLFSNNLFFGSTAGTKPGSTNVTSDPLFINETTKDFHLRPNSPAINKGTTYSTDKAGKFDFYGTTRTEETTDIGAAEYHALTAVHDFDNKPVIDIFPNPFTNACTISIQEKAVLLRIFSIEGRRIETLVSSEDTDIHLGEKLPSGMYFIFIETADGKRCSRKVVKL